MEYQTEKGNPYPLCLELDCAAQQGDLATDCWNRHWEGCRRSIPAPFHNIWTDPAEAHVLVLGLQWQQGQHVCKQYF